MLIQTMRLILREFRPDDLAALAEILAKPEVMKFSLSGALSAVEAQAKLERFINSYREYGFGKWAVILKDTNQLIGYCGIAVERIDDQEETEIGYRFDPAYWDQGYATEAAAAALDYGVDRLKLPHILGIVERANFRSVRVLQKLGMTYERETIFYGVKMDVYRRLC